MAFRVFYEDDEGNTANALVSAQALADFLEYYAGRVLDIREEPARR